MSLNLDARQRAMLQEMGIKVWAPAPARSPAPQPAAYPAEVAPAPVVVPAAPFPAHPPSPPAAARPPSLPTAAPTPANPSGRQTQWLLSLAAPLFPPAANAAAPQPEGDGKGWLVLLEAVAPNSAQAQDRDELLQQMLRALRLHTHPQVLLATLGRPAPGQPFGGEPMDSGLPALLAQHRPGMVLLLGLGAARAALGGNETLAQLRQRSHHLPDGTPAVVSFDPGFLLRAPQSKALAWADLCEALALTRQPA